MKFLDKVKDTLLHYNMLSKGCKIVVGFSGGADSAALLKALCMIKDEKNEFDFTLNAAHINHCLRGSESDRDEQFVRDYCRLNGVQLSVLKKDITAERLLSGENEEECGRRIRYEFFSSLAGENGKIATAHTLSDSTETVLMNIVRGCTLPGLCGIPPVNGNIIRPLISVSRAQTEEFCRECGIDYVTDSTNLEDVHRRNILRHSVIPVLKQLNPSFEHSVENLTAQNRRENEFLVVETEKAVKNIKKTDFYDISLLKELPQAVLYRAVKLICSRESGFSPEYRQVDEICRCINGGKKAKINLPHDFSAVIADNSFIIKPQKPEKKAIPSTVTFEIPGRAVLGEYEIIAQLYEKKEINGCEKIHSLLSYSLADSDKINKKLTVRCRIAGDRISLSGRGITKELRKLWNEKKVPPGQRDLLPVVCDANGIVYAPFAGCDSRVAINGNKEKCIVLGYRKIGKEV